ncbi:hypothetical protein IMZ48_14540 [Candidatus Bathyarchaeota archaeon]|nr:hypothetical protein [Candidatus Bathyarchaeota archaeon]
MIPESDLEFDDAAMATIPPAFDPIVEDALGISRYDSEHTPQPVLGLSSPRLVTAGPKSREANMPTARVPPP